MFLLFLLAVSAHGWMSDKRVEDTSRSPAITGGGRVSAAKRQLLLSPDVAAPTTRLLEEDSQSSENSGRVEDESVLLEVDAVNKDSYSFLLDDRYADCYKDDRDGQGYSCNSCWAFAVQNMMNARRCKAVVDQGKTFGLKERVTPLNLICHIQGGICEPKDIAEALAYAKDTGLVTADWMERWGQQGAMGGQGFLAAFKDPSDPTPGVCKTIFEDSLYPLTGPLRFSSISFSAPPHNVPTLKRRLLFGPVIGTVRLTWEFQIFTGSLFNPAKHTFCRIAKSSDRNNYCDPSRMAQWDVAQVQQQLTRNQDDWYNHFVTIHGWGVKKSAGADADVPYWIVENSWGRIYQNDPSLVNNGAGKNYRAGSRFDFSLKNSFLYGKNHFLAIAQKVAGTGGLEMTSREVYSAKIKL